MTTSRLKTKFQQQSEDFADTKGYELVDFGVFAKSDWPDKDSFYGIQLGLNLASGNMGLILVWFRNDDCIKCSNEFQAKNLAEFRAIFDHLDTAIDQLGYAEACTP